MGLDDRTRSKRSAVSCHGPLANTTFADFRPLYFR